jgi:hypothetical protein
MNNESNERLLWTVTVRKEDKSFGYIDISAHSEADAVWIAQRTLPNTWAVISTWRAL